MKSTFYILLGALFLGCNSSKLPKVKYAQYEYYKSYSIEKNSLKIEIQNPLQCPLRVWVLSKNEVLQGKFKNINPIELHKKSDTLISVSINDPIPNDIRFASRLGTLKKEIKPIKIELPFPKNRKYRVIQGNNSSFTHNTPYSRFAIDFDLKENDTICSATDGFVVGVIEKYKHGGTGKKWRPYANFITIYEPNSGVFTQYVHLVENGSFVSVGDRVRCGQPIGLSGKTGRTDTEHLHFNCLIPVHSNEGLKSIPIIFKEGYNGSSLKKNDLVSK